MVDTLLSDALSFDGLAAAETITGQSYKDDKSTEALGLFLHFTEGAKKNALLAALDDTSHACLLSDYLRIAVDEGFEIVLQIPFLGISYAIPIAEITETFYVMFHKRDGILLCFDTFGGDKVNGGNFYYNWVPNSEDSYHEATSNGSFMKVEDHFVWVGYHNCREALRHKLSRLGEKGSFLTPWVEQPFLWLLHYMDYKAKDYDYKAIIAARIAMLPEYVQKAIVGEPAP